MTGEQAHGRAQAHLVDRQIMWHRVRRGICGRGQLIRPFDKTMHEICRARESRTKTWVWNPRTAAWAYIAHTVRGTRSARRRG